MGNVYSIYWEEQQSKTHDEATADYDVIIY